MDNSNLEIKVGVLSTKINELGKNLGGLSSKVEAVVDILGHLLQEREEATKNIDDNFETLNKQIQALDDKMQGLTGETKKGFTQVKEELKKIHTATGYKGYDENLKIIGK